jgi:hypothetical protein
MTALAQLHRQRALDLIAKAQAILSEAAQTANPLRGWSDEWKAIGDHYDATKALWHRCNSAPLPTTHDSEPRAEE